MSKPKAFQLQISDGNAPIGTVIADSDVLLRALGAANTRDQTTKGTTTLCDTNGDEIASFDVWTNQWDDADANRV